MTQRRPKLTGVNNSILRDYAKLRRVGLNNLEFDRPHAATDEECVTLANRAVRYLEISV